MEGGCLGGDECFERSANGKLWDFLKKHINASGLSQ